MQGISTKQERMREKQSRLEAKRCPSCGAWFTIKGRRDRDRCFRCEKQEGQASDGP